MGQAESVDKKIVEERQMNNVWNKRNVLVNLNAHWSSWKQRKIVQESLVTYEPGRKFTDKINQVNLSDSRVQVVSEMNLEELIGLELRSFPMNFKLMISHRET